ncbi:MAG: hypothetical protein WA063_05720 [Minisyncoccia bacterium]
MAKKEELLERSELTDERNGKIAHNQEVHEKIKKEEPGILGDDYMKHHKDRCRG